MSERSERMQRDREIAEGRHYRPDDIAGSLRDHVNPYRPQAAETVSDPVGDLERAVELVNRTPSAGQAITEDDLTVRPQLSPVVKKTLADATRIAAQVAEAYPELPGVVAGMGDIREMLSTLL